MRLYRFGNGLERVQKADQFTGAAEATHIGDALKQVASEATSLPIGAVVLVSDGADNTRRRRPRDHRRDSPPAHSGTHGGHRPGAVRARHRDRRRGAARPDAGRFARQRAGDPAPARLRRAEGAAGGFGRRQAAGLAGSDAAQGRGAANRDRCSSTRESPAPRPSRSPWTAWTARRTRRTTPSCGWSTWRRPSRASSTSKASRAGSIKFIRRALGGGPQRPARLHAADDAEQDLPAGRSRMPRNWSRAFPSTAEELFAYQGLIIGQRRGRLLHAGAAGTDPAIRRTGGAADCCSWAGARRSPTAATRPRRWPICSRSRCRTAREPSTAIRRKASLTPAGRDSLICRLVEQPEQERRTLEEAAGARRLPGGRRAEAGGPGAGGSRGDRQRNVPAAGHAELRPGAHGAVRDRRKLALADAAGLTRIMTHEIFWQQLLRWLVTDTPRAGQRLHAAPGALRRGRRSSCARRCATSPSSRSRTPSVEAHIMGPEGVAGHARADPVAHRAGRVRGRVDGGEAGLVPGGGHGDARQRSAGPRRAHLPPGERRGGEFPRRAEPRTAGEAVRGDRRPVLHAGQPGQAERRDFLFRGRHHHARDPGPLGHAGRLPVVVAVCGRPNGCCAGSGAPYEAIASRWRSSRCPCPPPRTTSPSPGWAASRTTSSASRAGRRPSTRCCGPAAPTPGSRRSPGPNATRDRVREVLEKAAQDCGPDDAFVLDADRPRHVRWRRLQVQPARPGHHRRGTGDAAEPHPRGPATGGEHDQLQRRRRWRRLRKESRIVITATKSGTEKNATVFAALLGGSAARSRGRHRQERGGHRARSLPLRRPEDGRRSTNRRSGWPPSIPLLEDSGKGEGVRDPEPEEGQGRLAAAFTLLRFGAAQAAAKDPAKQKLLARKEELEQQIDKLKYQKAAMTAAEYKKQLGALLLELARTRRSSTSERWRARAALRCPLSVCALLLARRRSIPAARRVTAGACRRTRPAIRSSPLRRTPTCAPRPTGRWRRFRRPTTTFARR